MHYYVELAWEMNAVHYKDSDFRKLGTVVGSGYTREGPFVYRDMRLMGKHTPTTNSLVDGIREAYPNLEYLTYGLVMPDWYVSLQSWAGLHWTWLFEELGSLEELLNWAIVKE